MPADRVSGARGVTSTRMTRTAVDGWGPPAARAVVVAGCCSFRRWPHPGAGGDTVRPPLRETGRDVRAGTYSLCTAAPGPLAGPGHRRRHGRGRRGSHPPPFSGPRSSPSERLADAQARHQRPPDATTRQELRLHGQVLLRSTDQTSGPVDRPPSSSGAEARSCGSERRGIWGRGGCMGSCVRRARRSGSCSTATACRGGATDLLPR
jgi:hypothetical protein